VKDKAYEYGLAVSQLAHDYGIYIASMKDSTLWTSGLSKSPSSKAALRILHEYPAIHALSHLP
jgi:hypothetical protein